ncbi:MAG: hypothetical protein GF417_04295 [Candidatus Latescibacteria bacterium]|nr:hypothetical protein [bacterium]MBD3423647.1 hypothetical protein [Candidatus Latescibacterota bacterium]
MLYFKRIILVSLLVMVLALSGCKSVITINNRTDPENFDQIILAAGADTYYDEVSVDVPDDIRKDDYEITNVDIFGDVLATEIEVALEVKLYIGLEPGNLNLDDSSINEGVASASLSPASTQVKIEVRNSDLIFDAFDQETFWVKVTIDYDVPSLTVVDVKNVYVDMQLERETGGLFPIFYLF